MRNSAPVKDEPRAGCCERVCMKLLIPKCRHIGLLSSCELVKVAELSAETRGCVIGRKHGDSAAKRLEGTEVVLQERVLMALPDDVSGRALSFGPMCRQPTGILGVDDPASLRDGECSASRSYTIHDYWAAE